MKRGGGAFERVKILVDTDIGSEIDDALALTYLVCNPACEVLGMTTVTGEARVRAMLASAICRAAGEPGIPICAGREQALAGDSFQRLVPQASALASLDHQTIFPQEDPIKFLRRLISEHSGEIVLLAIGPLTHVAELFESDTQIPRHLRRLITMCGHFPMSHEDSQEPVLEWNACLDPEAAEIVFRTTVAGGHYVVGSEITQRLRLPMKVFTRKAHSPALQAVFQLHQSVGGGTKPLTVYDLVAAVLALKPQLAESERGTVKLSLDDALRRGSTSWRPNRRAGRQRLFTSIDPRKILREFLSIFNVQRTACHANRHYR